MTNCTVWHSFERPLWAPPASVVNPCFIADIGLVAAVVFAVLCCWQLLELVFYNWYGPYRIKYAFGQPWSPKSVGMRQLIKVNSVVLNVVLWLVLATASSVQFPNAIGAMVYVTLAMMVLFVVPLHVIEPTRSVIASASLLLFWGWQTLFVGAVVLQDAFTSVPVFKGETAAYTSILLTTEVVVFVNSAMVFLMETTIYSPSRELQEYWDVNGWDTIAVHNLFSRLFFYFMQPTIERVYRSNELALKEVEPMHISFSNAVLHKEFEDAWLAGVKNAGAKYHVDPKKQTKVSVAWILCKLHWVTMVLSLVYDTADMILGITQAFLLQKFILFFTNYGDGSDSPLIEGFALCTLNFIAAVLKFVLFNQFFVKVFDLRFGIQSQLTSNVYNKAVRLSKESRKEKSTGDIVNVLSSDVNNIAGAPQNICDLIITPIRLISAMVALIHVLGVSTFCGLGIGCIIVPLNSVLILKLRRLYKRSQKIKDERVRLTSEILTTVKSIKLYAWEKPLLKRLFDLRNLKELKVLKTIGLLNAVSMFCWSCVPFVIQCGSLITFTYIGKVPMIPSVVFPALSLFGVLTDPFLMVPYLFSGIVQNNVSLGRVRNLLMMPEADYGSITRTNDRLQAGDAAAVVVDGTFEYGDGTSDVALENVNFSARKGQLTCIVGRVGSGKSSMIKALLGQLPVKHAKKVAMNGSVAYAAQDPWIMNATVRENILFGHRFDKAYYDLTCEACQLGPDFAVLADGDRTTVGEKGISLSGGQKARIALARAVYSRADVVLLDDVLSAVDVHVGKAITDKVLSTEGLLATKTVVLATNAISVLPLAGDIYLMDKGKIVERGPYEVAKSQGQLAKLIEEFGAKEEALESELDADKESDRKQAVELAEAQSRPQTKAQVDEALAVAAHEEPVDYVGEDLENQQLRRKSTNRASIVSYSHDYDADDDNQGQRRTGGNAEVGAKGAVKLSVYLEYFRACNYGYLVFYVASYGIHVALKLLSEYTLKHWSELNLEAGHNVRAIFYVSLYAGLGVTAALCTLFGTFIVWTFCTIRGSQYFHDNMAKAVVASPMQFFDTTPIGRILNRFSEDIGVIDGSIMWTCMGLVDFGLEAAGLLSVVVINLPWMALVIAVLFVVYDLVRRYYIPASRELKRLSSAQKSPIYALLQESLNGIETIAAYAQVDRFIYRNQQNVDDLTKLQFSNAYCNRWLSMRLQLISSTIIYTTMVFIWLTLGTPRQFSPGLVGFVMINVMGVTWTLNTIIRFWAQLEQQSVSLERVIEYCQLPSEGTKPVEGAVALPADGSLIVSPPSSWPAGGNIDFKDYTCRYRENLDPVLKGISVSIPSEAKVGIVGRTGAGKSTLSLALFRMIEPSAGHVEIDGLNTSDLSLYDLRRHLNIIPQDANAVEGTVRENLDPLGEHSDEELWKVLEMAHLKDHIAEMKTKRGQTSEEDDDKAGDASEQSSESSQGEWSYGLDARIFEGGSNLSSGQRQLMSLARALLNPSKVLVLDEATAAVDVQTDKILQQTIREQFKDKTILTIAHRLETVMDCDYILVLERGEVKEFASPKDLLENKDSVFYSMVQEHEKN
ncbi:bile pigment transporter 1 [Diutina catenulata]